MQLTLPTPTADETCERFTIRSHRALSTSIPDPSKRNEVVWDLWRKHRGETEQEKIANEIFGSAKYVRIADSVCVFAEHSATDGQGKPRKYDLGELARITRCCNERISDFDGFVPISDGHTPNPDDADQTEPDIIGYAGPFRLGMIGRTNPRWAIFEDEFALPETAERLKKKPRRSVELWTFQNDPTRTHFDPVAAIGSEAPRLPLPVKFSSRYRDGAFVERYTFDAPSFVSPGAGNTHLKKFQREGRTMLTNEDLGQIVQALQETPQMQFLNQLMESGGATSHGAAPGGDAGGELEADAGGEQTQYADDDEAVNPGGNDIGGGDDLADLNDLLIDPDEDDEEGQVDQFSRRAGEQVSAVKYSKLRKAHNSAIAAMQRMSSRTQALERKATDAERTNIIQGLANKYAGFVDVGEELGAVLYSRGKNLNDDAFKSHIATVEKYAKRSAMNARANSSDIPSGEVDYEPQDATNEKYQAKLNAEAVRIYSAEINKGNHSFDYDDAMAKATEIVSR